MFTTGFIATQADAASCKIADVTVSTDCMNVDGKNSKGMVNGLFGLDVDFEAKVDAPGTSDGILSITYDSITYDKGDRSGTWSVDCWSGFSCQQSVTSIRSILAGPAGWPYRYMVARWFDQSRRKPARELTHLAVHRLG